MAAKRSASVDYRQFHSFSSVVLYDTTRKRTKFYEAERIIEKRKKGKNFEYLVKWKDWPLESSSWEPANNLNVQLLRSYTNSVKASDEMLQEASRKFSLGVYSSLKSTSVSPVYIDMRLDVWRYVVHNKGTASNHRGHLMLGKEDMCRLKFLPHNWWYILNIHGQGTAVEFPIKVKPVLSWSPSCYMANQGKLCKAPRIPNERLCISILKQPCNTDTVTVK